jgi:hypothetical protein
MIESVGKLFAGLAAAVGFFILAAMLGTLLGAFIVWVLTWSFGEWVVSGAEHLGAKGIRVVDLPNIGAALGFVGSFLKSPPVSVRK